MNSTANASHWTPRPLDLSNVELSPELERLSDRLARNIHDLWAEERIKNGWSYGPARNDDLKQTPCLVSYEDLPEEERAYDKIMATQTLRMILSLGYAITQANGATRA